MNVIKIKDLNLKQLRNIYDLKQKTIADCLQITKQGYQYKEAGERKFKQHELILLSKIFNIDLDTLKIIVERKQENKLTPNVDKINLI